MLPRPLWRQESPVTLSRICRPQGDAMSRLTACDVACVGSTAMQLRKQLLPFYKFQPCSPGCCSPVVAMQSACAHN